MGTVLITVVPYEDVIDRMEHELRRRGHQVRRDYTDARWKESELLGRISGVDALIADYDEITGRVIESADHLKVISRCGVGVDNIDLSAAVRKGVVVTNTPGVMASSVADLTFALLLATARKIPLADNATKAGKWPRLGGRMVAGKTLGIIGVGRIGKEVAKRAAGFNMRILGYDLCPDDGFAEHHQLQYVPLASLLRESDFVTLHVALSPSTRHMIGDEQLSLMKETAFLINTSRGGVVDEGALLRALGSGAIAGAALDTFQTEPPANSPLLRLDNVITTPHIGSSTHEAMSAMADLAVRNAVDVLEGRTPEFVVNPEVLRGFSR